MIRADGGQDRPKLFLKFFNNAAAAFVVRLMAFSRSSSLGTKANGANSLAFFKGKFGRTTISLHGSLMMINRLRRRRVRQPESSAIERNNGSYGVARLDSMGAVTRKTCTICHSI